MTSNRFKNVSGVKFVGKKRISLLDIGMKISCNAARSSGIDNSHVTSIADNIRENGILEHLPRPVVEVLTPAKKKAYDIKTSRRYVLHDGHHRVSAMDILQFNDAEFDVVECDDETARRALQIAMNTHPPAKSASQLDYTNWLSGCVASKKIQNTQTALTAALENLAPTLAATVKTKIITDAIKISGGKIQWLNWGVKKAAEYLAKYGLVESAKWNPKTGRYGAVMTAEAEWRVLGRALENFVNPDPNGNLYTPTDIVIKVHLKGDNDASEKRRAVRDSANEIMANMLAAAGVDEFPNGYPIRFVAYLPQDLSDMGLNESEDKFYPICTDPSSPDYEMIDGA